MRMRKKKNLEDRLARCEKYLLHPTKSDLNFETAVNSTDYIDLAKIFENPNAPLHLEIGCGKGGFACTLAKNNPDINVLAVEKVGNVIVAGCERAMEENIPNLKFLKIGAEYLPCYIKPHSVDRMYLNFSCPYPKKRYASHRLTHPRFLNIYKQVLADGAEIHQKTDNMQLFEFSIEQFSSCGFALKNVSLDLHASDFEGNIMTEYEKNFTDMGKPIYRLEAYLR